MQLRFLAGAPASSRLAGRRPLALVPLVAVVIAASGCANLQPQAGWPEERPLGADVTAYRPPVEPAALDASSPFESVESDSLTLPGALAQALLHNPELQAFGYEVRAREAERVQAGRWPNPAIGMEAEEVDRSGPGTGFGDATKFARISQPIALGGDVRFREDMAVAARDLAGWDYEIARLDVITEVSQTFAGALAAQERLAQTRELLQLAEALRDAVAEQVEAGEVSRVELERVTVERARARITARQAEEQLLAARQRLAAALGERDLPCMDVQGELEEVRDIPPLAALSPFLARNPALARYTDLRRQREAQVGLERARRIPDPTISGGVQRFGATGERAVTFGVSIPLPLFDRNQGAIDAARYRLDQVGLSRRQAEVELSASLESAYRNLAANYTEVVALREEVLPAAEAAFATFEEGYRLGEFDLLSVIDSQRTLFGARLQYVAALEAYRQVLAEVERIVATPLSAIESQ